jgi:glutamate carboxypeptidase
MQARNAAEQTVVDWLASQHEAMLALLERMVNTDSGSRNKGGVDAVGEVLKAFYAEQDLGHDTIANETFGEAIRVPLPHATANDQRPIVLMGHRDTVFPDGEAGRRPFRIEDGRAYGPGVADMKAGLVMNAFLMAAFKRFGGNPGPLLALITSDEEIASPSSRPIIAAEARAARAVFNSEPGRPTGNVVNARKGGVFMNCDVKGKASHSGGAYKDGISAIEELAQKITRLHALTDFDRGITINVGLISGGQTVNTVAPNASCEIDMRYIEAASRDGVVDAVREIVETSFVAGTVGTFRINGEFLPLEPSADSNRLLSLYQSSAADAGLTVAAEFSGGCADSGISAGEGCPTICSVGPVGGLAHTPEEYLETASIVPRAQSAALAIMRISEAEL